jgi:hypothetical protein
MAIATSTAKAKLKTMYGLEEKSTPFIKLSVDLYQSVILLDVIMFYMHAHMHCIYRSTPVETLHTILLGPYKYLLRKLMSKLTSQKKEEIRARIRAFSYTGFKTRLSTDICKYTGSLVGRDFKVLAQMAVCPNSICTTS